MSRRKQIQDRAVDKGDDVRLHIDSLVSSINAMVPHELLMSPNWCIFKTPVTYLRHNENAFIPDAFSIGPLHHGKRNFKAAEKIKFKYLQDLISCSPSPETMLSKMVGSIMEVEKEAREYYAAPLIHYNSDDLVKILVTDGCFIIEFLYKNASRHPTRYDPIFSGYCMLSFLEHDLILLENQVPWMVLERLFNLTKDPSEEGNLFTLATTYIDKTGTLSGVHSNTSIKTEGIKHFVDLLRLLSTVRSTDGPPDQSLNSEGTNHFVHLFRKLSTSTSTLFRKLSTLSSTLLKKWSPLSSSTEEQKGFWGWEQLPSATNLVEAGIKFDRSTSRSILDIQFKDGVLKLPPLAIDDTTETMFRNLISYEQCCLKEDHSFTSYVMLLDNLIITAKDMDILCKNQIIHCWLNTEDATQLFNKLYYNTCVNNSYQGLSTDINRYCKRRWPRWRAMLVRNYFNTPWAVLSTSAAVILLILTLLQTIYGIKK